MKSHDHHKKVLSHAGGDDEAPASEVLLVNMPFTALAAPSIALGLLKSGLR